MKRNNAAIALQKDTMFFSVAVLLAMPWLLGFVSDRIFSYTQLFRAMLDVMLWLSFCAGLGVVNGTIRLFSLNLNQRPHQP